MYCQLRHIKNYLKMATISQMQKQAKSAPKFVLINNTGHYIADMNIMAKLGIECVHRVTFHLHQALLFNVGFDDEKMKSRAWSISTGENFYPKYL